MNIRSIQNNTLTNLSNCENEPIHIPGSIQPHGFFMGLKTDDLEIEYCSANTPEYLNLTHTQLLGKKFEDVFGQENKQRLQKYADKLTDKSPGYILDSGSMQFFCTIHLSSDVLILEAEPKTAESLDVNDFFLQSREFIAYMEETNSLQQLCDLVSKGIRKITGYDRVMIYRFDKEYNGEVIAESKREDLEGFLGLHYPHTDIPAQARVLYLKNLLRHIVDINYTPVPLFTISERVNDLDLSLSILRSTSPIHVQYLQNMGVGATLTISLIHRGKLWGLVACHHYSPRNISPEVRLSAKLLGHFITSQIEVRQTNDEYETSKKVNGALEELLSLNLKPDYPSLKLLVKDPALLKICNASGVSIKVNSQIFSHGDTPDKADMKKLQNVLLVKRSEALFSTNELSKDFPDQNFQALGFPGICYVPFNEHTGDCIIWYRKETVKEINWAGDPEKAILKDASGLSPRNSFKLWKQKVSGISREWLACEILALSTFSNFLQKHLMAIIRNEDELKQQKIMEILKEANSELENMNWIGTHDLQEPLRKIQMTASQLLSDKDAKIPAAFTEKIGKMSSSAKKMQNLIKDILKYSKSASTSENFEHLQLNQLLKEVQAEIADSLEDKGAKVVVGSLPEINGVPFLLKQLFTNLFFNSLKFSKEGRKPEISIRAEREIVNKMPLFGPYHKISYTDNGMGFEPKFNEEIFDVFKRLNVGEKYTGSGIGLAICRKIMKTHHGSIQAFGEPDAGALFILYFPIEKVKGTD